MNEREDLKAYLDGELSESRVREIEAALKGDPELRDEVQQMKRIGMSLRGHQQPVGEGNPARVQHALRERGRRFPVPMMAVTAAACIIGLFAAFPLFKSSVMVPRGDMSTASAPAKESTSAPVLGQAEAPAADMAIPMESAKAKSTARDKVATSPSPPDVANILGGRDVIRDGNIGVAVKSLDEARRKLTDGIRRLGGFMESSSVQQSDTGGNSAEMTLRMPAARFEEALDLARASGRVVSESTTGQDVTATRVDLEARVRTLKLEEDQVRAIMRTARRTGELLEIRDRLSQIRMEIESMEAQLRSLKSLAAMSTLRVTLTERPIAGTDEVVQEGWAQDTWATAVKTLSGVGRFLGQAAIWLAVFSPLWVPLAWWLRKSARKAD
jgi:hypothetical protein